MLMKVEVVMASSLRLLAFGVVVVGG